MAKRKKLKKKKSKISDDPRWIDYDELKRLGKIFEATKLKFELLDSYKWKKPCHHIAGKTV